MLRAFITVPITVLIISIIVAAGFASHVLAPLGRFGTMSSKLTLTNTTLLNLREDVNGALHALESGNTTVALNALRNANNTLYSPHR
jgi:hypothetical protein